QAARLRLDPRTARGRARPARGHDRAHLHDLLHDRPAGLRHLVPVLQRRLDVRLRRPEHAGRLTPPFAMGLLDYYRQFAGMSDEEISAELREQADEQRRRALARIDQLDLSRTTWHELPHPDVVNAVTYAARGALNV